jgi:hypothetical protein
VIVNPTEKGWEVIYHRAHALLAAQIASHWGREKRPARVIETIAAISHHDDLEREWKGDHRTESGAPLDFTLDPKIDVHPLRTLIDSALYRSRWVALLTSMHVAWTQEPRRGQSAELDTFLKEQEGLRKQWRRDLKTNLREAEEAYAFLLWCDQLSLILCQRQIPERGRILEIGTGPDGQRYGVTRRDDGTLKIDPWPFGPERLTVQVETFLLDQLSFKSDAELTRALQAAPMRVLSWEMVEGT